MEVQAPTTLDAVTTQFERSSATRERTIAAAVACLAEHGFAGTSIAVVARRAGISRGAVQHQFPDKFSLVAEVVDAICRRHTEQLHVLVGALPQGRERIEGGLDALWEVFRSDSYVATLELYAAGRTEPALRTRILRFDDEVRAGLRGVLAAMVGPVGDADRLRERSEVFLNHLRGLSFHRAILGDTGIEGLWEILRADTVADLGALTR